MSGNVIRFSLITLLFASQLAIAQERAERSGRGGSVPPVYLRTSRAAAEAEHDALWSLDAHRSRARFRTLAPEMRADVWTIHLERYLLDHPDLTVVQRAVIIDALDLISTGVIEASAAFDHDGPIWEMTVHQPVAQIEQRALVAFGPDGERELLELPSVRPEAFVQKRAIVNSDIPCDCSTLDEPYACAWPYSTCVRRAISGCYFTPSGEGGCGPLGNYGCNGLCE